MSIVVRIAESQNHRCCYCRHPMIRHVHQDRQPTPRNAATKDHVIPRAYGGATTYENMVAACLQCNNLRGEIDAVTFYNIMHKWFKKHPELHTVWHQIPYAELRELKIICLLTYERQLRGQAIRYIEMAFRHNNFTWQRRQLLRALS